MTTDSKVQLDTQQVEIVGRNLLVSLLVSDGLEVAEPIRDRGIDLVAFQDIATGDSFRAVPIQLKAFSRRGFGVYQKYEKFPTMLMAYVWFSNKPLDAVLYILTHRDAVAIADRLGWTNTESWKQGGYSSTRPSAKLIELLEPHRYRPGYLVELLEKAYVSTGS